MVEPWIISGGAAAVAGGAAAYGALAPGSRLFGPIVRRGPIGHPDAPPRIALTFDDGPHPRATPAILDILHEHRVPAAFFVIGRNAAHHPAPLRRADAEGHLIANHTYDHHRLGTLRPEGYWLDQLVHTSDVIERTIGRRPALFRPPMGIKTPRSMNAARRLGMTVVTWSRRGLDGWATTKDRILGRLVDRCRAGDVIVLHDGTEPGRRRDPRPTIDALPELIAGLSRRGFQFDRLDRLIGAAGYVEPSSAPEPAAPVDAAG